MIEEMLQDKVQKELEDITPHKAREIVNNVGVLIYQGCHLQCAVVHECYEKKKME